MKICPLCQEPIVKGQPTFRGFFGRGPWKHQFCVKGPKETTMPNSFNEAVSLSEAIRATYESMPEDERQKLDKAILALNPPSNQMKTTNPKIPCGDQLREAWLEAVEMHAIVSEILSCLDAASTFADDGSNSSLKQATKAKQELDNLYVQSQEVRDMIIIWQAWASGNSSID